MIRHLPTAAVAVFLVFGWLIALDVPLRLPFTSAGATEASLQGAAPPEARGQAREDPEVAAIPRAEPGRAPAAAGPPSPATDPGGAQAADPVPDARVAGVAPSIPARDLPAFTQDPLTLPAGEALPEVGARAFAVMDYATGALLASRELDLPLEPASVTKVMTAYVVLDALERGALTLEEDASVSREAWRMEGSRMFIEPGSQVPVGDLLTGLIVQSGNDAAVALAEHLAGSSDAFAAEMNAAAAQLGLTGSHFQNPSGLPAEGHHTTARDLTTLGRALIARFPDHYPLFAQRSYTWNGITQPNRNRLLDDDPTFDGLKTGYTASAGYCLLASAHKDGMRLMVAVLGADTSRGRFADASALARWGFERFVDAPAAPGGVELGQVLVYKGEVREVGVGLAAPVVVTVPRESMGEISTRLRLGRPLTAPVAAGQVVGSVEVRLGETVLARRPLVTRAAVPAGPWWAQLRDGLWLWASPPEEAPNSL